MDIIKRNIHFDGEYGDMQNVPARFNMDEEAPAELIDINMNGLILTRDQLVAWTSEAEVSAIEADADERAVEDGILPPPHDWKADEARIHRNSVGWMV